MAPDSELFRSKVYIWGWGFSSAVERLPSKHKALGSVLSSEEEEKKMSHESPHTTDEKTKADS